MGCEELGLLGMLEELINAIHGMSLQNLKRDVLTGQSLSFELPNEELMRYLIPPY